MNYLKNLYAIHFLVIFNIRKHGNLNANRIISQNPYAYIKKLKIFR